MTRFIDKKRFISRQAHARKAIMLDSALALDSDQAILDACIAKHRQYFALNEVFGPLFAAGWTLARGRGRTQAKREARKNLLTWFATQVLYEGQSIRYRRTLSDEPPAEKRDVTSFNPVVLRDLVHYGAASLCVSTVNRYRETCSLKAAAKRLVALGVINTTLLGLAEGLQRQARREEVDLPPRDAHYWRDYLRQIEEDQDRILARGPAPARVDDE